MEKSFIKFYSTQLEKLKITSIFAPNIFQNGHHH